MVVTVMGFQLLVRMLLLARVAGGMLSLLEATAAGVGCCCF